MTGRPYIIALLLTAGLALMALTQSARAEQMLPIADGIPSMPDMVVITDSFSSFDTASGRIESLETRIFAPLTRRQVLSFYRTVMAPLGWDWAGAEKAAAFRRDTEVLLITISASREGHIIRFDLRPGG